MTKRDKLRQKLRNNPSDATMQEVETLLSRFGFTLARVSGSHHIYEYDDGERNQQITIPLHGRKVKKAYVQRVSEILDELFPLETTDEPESEDDSDE
jgi:predicted RNA binding protein YcfA (HicA-like mRNA interferase family)